MIKDKYYAGIGSRDCPLEVLKAMNSLASWLSKRGYILRSGGAEGSDRAFEEGCDLADGKKEIFLPWRKFNNSNSNLYLWENLFEYYNQSEMVEIARKYHPYFDKLKDGAKRLIIRDAFQVLGGNLDNPSDFIICYTKNGSGSGGTGQAIRIAKGYNIPVFDFGKYESIEEARREFMIFIKKFN